MGAVAMSLYGAGNRAAGGRGLTCLVSPASKRLITALKSFSACNERRCAVRSQLWARRGGEGC